MFTTDGGVPLVRYDIGDAGGVIDHETMTAFCERHGFAPGATLPADVTLRPWPFAYVFGRALSSVSFFGTNVAADTVTVALERPPLSDAVTGKFVLETAEDADLDRFLRITVELAPGVVGTDELSAMLADAIHEHLERTSSEFTAYVPPGRRRPEVVLRPRADPVWFPQGVKHRYVRAS